MKTHEYYGKLIQKKYPEVKRLISVFTWNNKLIYLTSPFERSIERDYATCHIYVDIGSEDVGLFNSYNKLLFENDAEFIKATGKINKLEMIL